MGKHKMHAPPPEPEHSHVIERPDGFYWRDDDNGEEFGPFSSLSEALADMEASTDADSDPLLADDSCSDIDDYVDPDTGEPDLGHIPHIEDY